MKIGRLLTLSLLSTALFTAGCTKYAPEIKPAEHRKVFLLYADGFNNLTSQMKSDVAALEAQAPRGSGANFAKLLIFTHFNEKGYDVPTSPVLTDVYVDDQGQTRRDTIKIWPEGTHSSDVAMIREVLTLVHDSFPAAEYGMAYSSHGTGWIPEGYFDSHPSGGNLFTAQRQEFPVAAAREDPHWRTLTGPAEYKSLGCEPTDASLLHILEMSVKDFAGAIPFRLDYIIFDACLMGGIETMFQMRGKARYILSSQTEIPGGGFYYENMLERIFYTEKTDLAGICADYVASYTTGKGASVSLVDCDNLAGFADRCKSLFDKYRDGMAGITPSEVQGFFPKNKHWYYDLEDILIKSGMEREDSVAFRSQLNNCVIYTDHTPYFDAIRIRRDCGMSMCLPCNTEKELKEYYRQQYDWNTATGLIQGE